MIAIDTAENAVQVLESHKPVAGMPGIIDDVYQEIKYLFETGQLDTPDFVELRSRLWNRREEVCEALLPAAQRRRR